jgi:hypothetical protein
MARSLALVLVALAAVAFAAPRFAGRLDHVMAVEDILEDELSLAQSRTLGHSAHASLPHVDVPAGAGASTPRFAQLSKPKKSKTPLGDGFLMQCDSKTKEWRVTSSADNNGARMQRAAADACAATRLPQGAQMCTVCRFFVEKTKQRLGGMNRALRKSVGPAASVYQPPRIRRTLEKTVAIYCDMHASVQTNSCCQLAKQLVVPGNARKLVALIAAVCAGREAAADARRTRALLTHATPCSTVRSTALSIDRHKCRPGCRTSTSQLAAGQTRRVPSGTHSRQGRSHCSAP